jgi:signal transduction histidine kinase
VKSDIRRARFFLNPKPTLSRKSRMSDFTMNPFSRFVAMALFVVLVAQGSILAISVWRESRPAPASEKSPAGQRTLLPQRVALGLAGLALALTLPLLLSAALRPARTTESRAPMGDGRAELSTLARLAESSVAQGEELSRERDERRRAEEDGRLKQQLLTQSLDEKIRLGRDLHDGIIQSLYAAGLTLESVRALVQTQPAEAERRLDQTRASLNDAIRDVRTYIVGLAPDSLRRAGFARALGHLLHELRAGREAEFDIQVDDEAAGQLTPEQSIEVLQLAREAVSNALRHGQATRITIRMHQGDHEVCLLVQDNGLGFDPARLRPEGHGVNNMHARASRIGASLRLTSQPGQGTRVLANSPVMPTPAA